MSKTDKPNIYTYHDHVDFLRDWFSYLKRTQNDFNIRNFAKKTNTAVGYVSMVLKRERELTEKGFQKISGQLGLNSEEKKYFNLLRIVSQSENPQVRLETVQEIMKIQKFKLNNQRENRTFEYLTKWYYVAIYEMFSLTDFKYDEHWIQGRLRKKISIQDVRAALDFLETSKFVMKNPNGSWAQVTPNLNCTEGIFKVSLMEFHHQMLQEAYNSIDEVSREERLIMGQTMAISRKDFDRIQKIIQGAIEDLNKVNKDSVDREQVYHIEIAAFPLTKKGK